LAVDNRAEQDENREKPQLWLCTRFRSRDRDVPHAEEAAKAAVSKHEGCTAVLILRDARTPRSSLRHASGRRAPQDEDGGRSRLSCALPCVRHGAFNAGRRSPPAHTFELQFSLLITGRKQCSLADHT